MTGREEFPVLWGDRPAPPTLLGFMVGTGVSVLIWCFIGWGAWALLAL